MNSKLIFYFNLLLLSVLFSCKKDTPWEDKTEKVITIEGVNAIINANTEWKDIFKGDTVDYIVKSMVKIQGSAVLTIKPGVKVSFETPESGIRAEENAGLNADGSAIANIVFTNSKENIGSWKGVIFASNSTSNKLNYVTIRCAGGAKDEGFCEAATAVGLARACKARASITNCSINLSGGYGIWVAGSPDINLLFSKNIFSSCTDASVALTADNMSKLDSLSTYGYNGKNYVNVYDIYGSEITSDVTIQRLSIPYRVSGRIYIPKTLTIMPGCVFEFNTGGELTTTDFSGANHTGVIKANGKAAPNNIIFKGVESQPGSWVGITITSKGSNSLTNCEISDAGSGVNYQNTSAAKGNIVVGRIGMGANASIKDCKISNSAGYGIVKYVNTLNPANSSVISTTTPFTINGHLYNIETNTFSNNSSGSIGVY